MFPQKCCIKELTCKDLLISSIVLTAINIRLVWIYMFGSVSNFGTVVGDDLKAPNEDLLESLALAFW